MADGEMGKHDLAKAQRAGDEPQRKVTSDQALGTSGTALGTNNDPRIVERSADRMAVLGLAVMTLLILAVEVMSAFTEAGRGSGTEAGRFTLYEASSVVVIVGMLPLLPRLISLGFPGVHPWHRLALVHGVGILAFSVIHVALMVALRKLLFPVLFEGTYIFTDNLVREFIYELRKDALTYAMGAGVIVLVREIAAGRKALSDAKRAAAPAMLTYRSGGRTVMIPAGTIRAARSEGNYAVVETSTGSHFVRVTLKSLLEDLAGAGVKAARVHRSHIVAVDAVREAKPTGSGDLSLTLEGGVEVPVSRRYREELPFG